MFEDYYQPQRLIAQWNTANGVWEKQGMTNLFCGHLELFLETWPTSGMTLNGKAFEQPKQEHPMGVSESSLLRTPISSEAEGGAIHPIDAKAGNHNLKLGWQILGDFGHIQPKLPTPTVSDQYTENLKSTQQSDGSLHSVTLAQIVHRADLLPTVTTQDAKNNGAQSQQERNTKPLNAEVVGQDWGRFEAAIRQWEQILGRKAPAPTKPDGKDGAHRLSSLFTEWMMGLPEGWITNVGLTRNEELKACGNGVVPQQALLALQILDPRKEN